jgi:hypothetical protein
VLLALGTLALAAVNFGMLIEMRHSTDRQHTDTAAVIEETQRIASQQHADTLESNRISREAYTSVQRAFVFVRELQFMIRGGNDPMNPARYPELWWFTPIVENSGSTPTKILQATLYRVVCLQSS